MQEKEWIFQYWLTELRQREASTLTVVSITSSASLVMLSLFLQPILQGNQIDHNWGSLLVISVGLGFSIAGLCYREHTKPIHYLQLVRVQDLMPEEPDRRMAHNFRDYVGCLRVNHLREYGIKLITIAPVFAWSLVLISEFLLKIYVWIQYFQSLIQF